MSVTSRTKEQVFLIALYKACQENEGTSFFNPLDIGGNLGFSPRQVKTIVQTLVQPNLIKKGAGGVTMAPNGARLAEQLIEEE